MKLSPARRRIIKVYEQIAPTERRSKIYIVRRIAKVLEYDLDKKGSHSFILHVINEHCIPVQGDT